MQPTKNTRKLVFFFILLTNRGLKSTSNYGTPSWVLKDVTTDLNYKNGYLSRYGIPKSYYEYKITKNKKSNIIVRLFYEKNSIFELFQNLNFLNN